MSEPAGFVGRKSERRILDEQLVAARAGSPRVVFVEGDAGSGKSSLLTRFLHSLSNATVVEASCDEAETFLSFGVVDQLRPGTPAEPGMDPMAVGGQLLDLLDRLQGDGRVVVVAIDDLQWADRSSLRAVLFVLRRLRADSVLTVVSTRSGWPLDPGWARFVGGDSRVNRIRLGGLGSADLVELATALGLGSLSQRGAARLASHTGGNALHCRALLEEIGVAQLNAAGDRGLPAPRELSGVILARVAALPPATQTFLAAAAVLGQRATIANIATVAGLPAPQQEVDDAVGSGLLQEGASISELSFAHPLYQAAIYDDLSLTNRRALHARAAGCVGSRARLTHLVQASFGPDDALAGQLEAAALGGAAAGDAGTSAWALEQAAFVSAAPEERDRRLLDAAVIHLNAADTLSAARVLASCQSSGARRNALAGLLGLFSGSPDTEDQLLSAWQCHDPAAEREIGTRAATTLANWMVVSGRPEQAVTWGERAVAGGDAGSPLWTMASTAQAYAFAAAGRSPDGLAVLGFLPTSGNEARPSETDALIMRGILRLYIDDLSGSIADLSIAASRLRIGVSSSYPGPCLAHLSDAYFRAGDWDAALTQAQLATSLAEDADRPLDLARAHGRAAQVLACQGQWPAAEAHVLAARSAAERFPQALTLAVATMATVSFAFARGKPDEVLAATDRVRAAGPIEVGGRPGIFNWRAMEIDALIGLGRINDAHVALAEFERAIPLSGLASANLMLTRSQGNLSAATGDTTGAADAFVRAHIIEADVAMPYEHALLSLDDGRRLRAAGHTSDAVEQLERAHRIFSDLGADPYVLASSTELTALEVSAAPDSPAVLLGLSRAELAVARLVAAGRTNKEAADELYVSVKTVEYHLRNSYIKLDIKSRRELTELLR